MKVVGVIERQDPLNQIFVGAGSVSEREGSMWGIASYQFLPPLSEQLFSSTSHLLHFSLQLLDNGYSR